MEDDYTEKIVEDNPLDSFDQFYNQTGLKGYDDYDDDYEEDEVEESKMLWANQISSLKQVLGSS